MGSCHAGQGPGLGALRSPAAAGCSSAGASARRTAAGLGCSLGCSLGPGEGRGSLGLGRRESGIEEERTAVAGDVTLVLALGGEDSG